MSGKDERIIRDIPACPICKEVPKYWVLSDTNPDYFLCGAWLLSEAYMKRNVKYTKRVIGKRVGTHAGFSKFLDTIVCVLCSTYVRNSRKHAFVRGDPAFEKVMNNVRFYHDREGFQKKPK